MSLSGQAPASMHRPWPQPPGLTEEGAEAAEVAQATVLAAHLKAQFSSQRGRKEGHPSTGAAAGKCWLLQGFGRPQGGCTAL